MQTGDPLRRRCRQDRQHGFTLLAVLAALTILALACERVMQFASQQAQREREAQLLRAGGAYAQAIAAYHADTPGHARQWPPTLEALIEDRRFVQVRRHLRERYKDPITRSVDWGLLRSPDGGIVGVYSRSDQAPLRSGAIAQRGLQLAAATRYADWKFVAPPAAPGEAAR
jgi:type II secretory pathway pseudopilin PulG